MKRQIVSEFRKLRTTRTAWGLLAGTLALVALGVVGVLWQPATASSPGRWSRPAVSSPSPLSVAWVFVLILGCGRSPTSSGTARSSRRCSRAPTGAACWRRSSSRSAAAAIVFTVAAAALTLAIGSAWLAAKGVAIARLAIGPLGGVVRQAAR